MTSRTCRRAILSTAAVAATLLGACTSGDDGPAPSSTPPTSHPAPAPAVALSYRVDVGPPTGIYAPTVERYGSTTVVSYRDAIRAVGPTGDAAWTFVPLDRANGYGVDFTVLGRQTVIAWRVKAATTTYRVRTVDTATGRVLWTRRTRGFVDTVPGTVFFTPCAGRRDRGCSVSALDPATGRARWSRTVAGRAYIRENGDVEASGPPVAVRRVLVEIYDHGISSDDTAFEAFDVATGRSRPVAGPEGEYARSGDVVAFVPFDEKPGNGCVGRVLGVDLRSGHRLWTRQYALGSGSGGCSDLDPSAPRAGLVALHPADGSQVVLDVRTGRQVSKTPDIGGTVIGHTAADVALVVRDGHVRAVRDGGDELWDRRYAGTERGDWEVDDPSVVNGRLVLGAAGDDGKADVVQPSTGRLVGRLAGDVVAHGEDWVATWDEKVVRVYEVRA